MSSTAITSNDFLITTARDDSVEGFYAEDNKKLVYLSTNLGEIFPNLIGVHASNCSIKTISKETFKGLNKLRELQLGSNQIAEIGDDYFDHIPSVEKIVLGE